MWQQLNYSAIKWHDIANGVGVRVSLFVSGCTTHCRNCFNKNTWDFHNGEPFDEEIQQQILNALNPEYISGLSLLGGEPLEPQNQRSLLPFVQKVKSLYPNKTVWCYTGFTVDEKNGVLCEHHKNTDCTEKLISLFDVVVDGAYIDDLKDIRLKYRGSSNQRILDIKQTLSTKTPVLLFEKE